MVWNPNDNDEKILKYLYDYREGGKAKNMINYIPMRKSTVYKRLKILEKHNLITLENKWYRLSNGEVGFIDKLLKHDKKIFELHNPGYVVRLPEVPKWWNPKGTQMRNKLMMLKGYLFKQIDFGKDSSNPYLQLRNDRFIIQMYPEAIIVIHRKRYYSDDAYELTKEFMNDFYDLWTWFEDKMKFKFFKDGTPQMTLRGHDYNRMNDWFANKLKKKKENFLVEIGDGRKVWVDASEPHGREANTPEIQVIMGRDIKDKVLNKPLLNSELQSLVGEIAQIQKIEVTNKAEYSRDLVEHKEAIKMMSKNTEENTKTIKMLVGIVSDLKEEVKRLKK